MSNGNIDRALTNIIRGWHDELDAPVEAAKIVRRLRADHYDELVMWLDTHAEKLMTEELRRRLSGFRRDVRNQTGPRAFEQWRTQAARGEVLDPPTALNMPYAVDAKGTWLKLGDMEAHHLIFAANRNEVQANTLRLEAGMLRALASKLEPGQKVRDRFSERDLGNAA